MQENQIEYKEAFNYAIKLLSKRDYSIYKLTQKLITQEITEECAQRVINKLIALKYLREEEFTKARASQLLSRCYANDYIVQKLSEEQLEIDHQQLETLRKELGLDSQGQIKKLIEKRLRYKQIPESFEERQKLKYKLFSFLNSKGYKHSNIENQIQEYIK
ncbi:MAG: hypothetical protein HON90_10445 [Halobacteriovoraceae bacterium]|jgi:regulatory protein|nr:hypothetical protein [Halobacteriovoraceae bacterium]